MFREGGAGVQDEHGNEQLLGPHGGDGLDLLHTGLLVLRVVVRVRLGIVVDGLADVLGDRGFLPDLWGHPGGDFAHDLRRRRGDCSTHSDQKNDFAVQGTTHVRRREQAWGAKELVGAVEELENPNPGTRSGQDLY